MSNSITTTGEGVTIHCMTVIGQIEGHYILPNDQKATKYEQIIPLLVSVEESDDIDGLLIILNTVGGDVEAGLALSEMIASMSKPTVSLVLGGGHSIGVPLAVSAKKSFIVPSATMTVHPVRTTGLVVSAPQTYNYFNRMQDRILKFIEAHSNTSAEKLREMMLAKDELATDMGTVLEGKQAVECGLIDEVGGLNEAIYTLREMAKGN
ncbi:MAG: ATP-dependent Clp protease proteolytic subunit [Clostridia bacterium]|nr:ATP-dependent Clp protease proteolytic subunit [Clostridia bacterium]